MKCKLLLTKWCLGMCDFISSMLIEVFWFGNGMPFPFSFFLLFPEYVHTYLASPFADFSFLSLLFPPSFIRPYFPPIVQSLLVSFYLLCL